MITRESANDIVKYYEISLDQFKVITPKTIKFQDSNGNNYFLKNTKYNVYEKYMFLNNQNINNILFPLKNKRNEFVTRNNNSAFYINNYIEDFTIIKEMKFQNMYNELNKLHDQTKIIRQLNPSSSRPKFEEITNRLDYKFKALENYVRSVEAKNLNIYSMPVLANYQYLLDTKKELVRLQKRIISSVKAKETIEYSFIHNNPKLEHLLNVHGNNYLTSIENSKIGLESLDLAKLYVENENLNIDYTGLLIDRFNNINPFYYDYFRYMVLLLYVEGLVLSTDEYINAQMFINTTNSIKKYFDNFKDLSLINNDDSE